MKLTSKLGVREIPNFEHVLITRIIETGDLQIAIKRRITADFFFMDDARTAYTYLIKHFQQFGEVPSIEMFRKDFRHFNLRTTSDTTWCNNNCRSYRKRCRYRSCNNDVSRNNGNSISAKSSACCSRVNSCSARASASNICY